MSFKWVEDYYRRESQNPRMDDLAPDYVLSTQDLLQHGQVGPHVRGRASGVDPNPRPRGKGRTTVTGHPRRS